MGEWDEPEGSEEEADLGFIGGGGPAETMSDDGDAEADEHAEHLEKPEGEES